jgi:hypothetical protein
VAAVRKIWWVLGIGPLCLPLMFVLWLVFAARWQKMDAVTIRMPMSLRQMVGATVLQGVPGGRKGLTQLRRVTVLDPDNAKAWARQCAWSIDPEPPQVQLQLCAKAASLDRSADNLNSLGSAQERAGDPCAAAATYTDAAQENMVEGEYVYVENMGRAALRCGDLYSAPAGLEAAISVQTKIVTDPNWDEDELDDVKSDLQTDREYLIVTLDRLHESKAAKEVCRAAHPDWSGCACKLDAKGTVDCDDAEN